LSDGAAQPDPPGVASPGALQAQGYAGGNASHKMPLVAVATPEEIHQRQGHV
jgi:hypothetical protein